MNEAIVKDIIHKMRVAMSCCCSEHRYKAVNKLLDQLEEELFNE